MTDLVAVKQRQQQTWAAGDFSVIATALYPTAEVLCDDVDFSSGQTVLDVACGSGNVAIAAARRHTAVTGIDYVPALLDRGRQRAAAEGLDIEFREADAEALPFEDGSFDVVLSAFGVMFAPNQEQAAAELLRVCRPGGRIGLANWTPGSAPADLFRLSAQFVATPPPPAAQPPIAWGTAGRLHELFGDQAAALRLHDRVWLARFDSAQHWVDTYRAYFGPVHAMFATLDERRAEEYAAGLADITHRFNRATDGTLAVANAYVTVVIDRA
ncbi:MAG: class I SAM-dependent methyltransferase [Euzebyaceae bacterium]|nr:class I SAM-dependent methyltransferase [Euzebyaceae bacterium]